MENIEGRPPPLKRGGRTRKYDHIIEALKELTPQGGGLRIGRADMPGAKDLTSDQLQARFGSIRSAVAGEYGNGAFTIRIAGDHANIWRK